MPTEAASLLPPNAAALELAVEGAAARAGDVPIPLAELWDPETCPPALLPWLAWSLSVDRWDADWPLATKRAAVADSIALHRIKGTRASVDQVLASFDQLLEVVEWHQAQPRAAVHTFDIVLPLSGEGIAPGGDRATGAFAEAVIREVSRVKPLSEHFRFVQQLAFRGGAGAVPVARAAVFVRRDQLLVVDATQPWANLLQDQNGEPLEDDAGNYIDGSA